MTDLEMTKACAEAMGLRNVHMRQGCVCFENFFPSERYDPLTNDEQAMELVKRQYLNIGQDLNGDWCVIHAYSGGKPATVTRHADLNRAIVECVAKAFVNR